MAFIDTHTPIQRLQEAGFTIEQAKAIYYLHLESLGWVHDSTGQYLIRKESPIKSLSDG